MLRGRRRRLAMAVGRLAVLQRTRDGALWDLVEAGGVADPREFDGRVRLQA